MIKIFFSASLIITFLTSCSSDHTNRHEGVYSYGQVGDVIRVDYKSDSFDNIDKYNLISALIIFEENLKSFARPVKIVYSNPINIEVDSVVYSIHWIDSIDNRFNKYNCVYQKSKNLVTILSNDEIKQYDIALNQIMNYEGFLNGNDTVVYLKNDLSILSILTNRCIYDLDSIVPERFTQQDKYFRALCLMYPEVEKL